MCFAIDEPTPTTTGRSMVTTEGPETETSPGPVTSLGSADITTDVPTGKLMYHAHEMNEKWPRTTPAVWCWSIMWRRSQEILDGELLFDINIDLQAHF